MLTERLHAKPRRGRADTTNGFQTGSRGPGRCPQVELITILDGGHVEPSLRYHYGWLYSRLVGTQNRDFESAEEAWRFFKDKSSR